MHDQPFTVDMFTGRDRVLTVEEVGKRQETVIDHVFVGRNQNVMFYSTNHIFGHRLLPEDCVSCTTTLPLKINPRPGFEDGVVWDGAAMVRFQRLCSPKQRIIETIEELVEYLNQNYSEVGQDR